MTEYKVVINEEQIEVSALHIPCQYNNTKSFEK